MLGLAGALIVVFLVIHYWEKLEGLISVGVGAAMPLIIGCVLAYVINILMKTLRLRVANLKKRLEKDLVR